jgi:hypothetical protein
MLTSLFTIFSPLRSAQMDQALEILKKGLQPL